MSRNYEGHAKSASPRSSYGAATQPLPRAPSPMPRRPRARRSRELFSGFAVFVCLALLALLALSACSRHAGRPRGASGRDESTAKSSGIAGIAPSIAVIGSSTASGFGIADSGATWVGRYAASLTTSHSGLTVRNFAVPGYSTYQVLPTGSTHHWRTPRVDDVHNVTAALATHPVALIVNLPSNDAAMGVPVEDTMDNLRSIVTAANAAGVPAWVTTSQPRNLDKDGIASLQKMRDAVLADFKDRSLNFWAPLAAADGTPLTALNQGDGIHPNAEGHRLLFDIVEAADIPGHLGFGNRAQRDH